MNVITDLLDFLDSSPLNFHAVATCAYRLEKAGFVRLDPSDRWEIVPAGKYYVTANDSAIFAFVAGDGGPASPFHIIAAHSDSPGLRLKPCCEMPSAGGALRLNVEVYGGPILYTWFDRPLSIAGRVITRCANPLRPAHRLVRFSKPLLTIPHLAIHFNRGVNEGNPLSKQRDMIPVVALSEQNPEGFVRRAVANELDIDQNEIIDYDLSLYDTTPAQTIGADNGMVTSGRLDDLSMVHAALSAMLRTCDTSCHATRVMAIFDNEETGSGTKQGAGSPVLEFILRRISSALGANEEDYMRSVAESFMISADNAHGFHPNYPEKYDPTNHPVLGGGPCIKINANCKYMTDADSAAVFASICADAGVPCQYFVNHSDVAGGSTLGNILTGRIPLRGVDMGAPVWAMHSIRETASAADHAYTVDAFTHFFRL